MKFRRGWRLMPPPSGNVRRCSAGSSRLATRSENTAMTTQAHAAPPDGLPTYRVLTGPDDAAFCRRVSDAIALGYKLDGAPAAAFNGEHVIVAQALLWPSIEASIVS